MIKVNLSFNLAYILYKNNNIIIIHISIYNYNYTQSIKKIFTINFYISYKNPF